MRNSFKVRKRSAFQAGLTLLMLAVFGYAKDLQSAQATMFWIFAGGFWLLFAFRGAKTPQERENAVGRRAFYNEYFGPLAFFAPSIPFLILLAAFLCMNFLPDSRWIVWALLALAAAYVITLWVLMARFLRRWRRELRELYKRVPPPTPPWDGADGVL